jgi:D-psicose/D-tagatose/L-ribulose 3-epimerase
MRIGINLLLWTGHVTETHRPVLQTLAELGYDGVEVPVMTGALGEYQQIGRWLDELGLGRTSSMAFTNPQADPISDQAPRRSAAMDQLKWQIECAHALGAEQVIGPMTQVLGQFTGEMPTETELARAGEVIASVTDDAAAAKVTLTIEPVNRYEAYVVNTLDQAAALARRINHPNVGIMLDTFHASLEEKAPHQALHRHGDKLTHFHCCENDRSTPGTGTIDFDNYVATLENVGYDGWLTVEAFGRAVPQLAAATCIWRDMFESQQQLARDAIAYLRHCGE